MAPSLSDLPRDQTAWIGCARCDIWYTWPRYQPRRCSHCGCMLTEIARSDELAAHIYLFVHGG